MASHEIITRSRTGALPARAETNVKAMNTSLEMQPNTDNLPSNTLTTTTVTVNAVTTQMSTRLSPVNSCSRPTTSVQTSPKGVIDPEMQAIFDRYERRQPTQPLGFYASTQTQGCEEPLSLPTAGPSYEGIPSSMMRSRMEPPISRYQGFAVEQIPGTQPRMMENHPRGNTGYPLNPRVQAGPVQSSSSVSRFSQSVRMQLPKFNGKAKWPTFIRQFEKSESLKVRNWVTCGLLCLMKLPTTLLS